MFLVIGVLLPQGYMAMSSQTVTRSSGIMAATGLGVYHDLSCSQPYTSVDWGVVYPDSTIRIQAYLKNVGNIPVTLGLSAGNWSPLAASQYMVLGWDYSGAQVSPSQVIPVTFSLTISPTISGVSSFSFDIIVNITH
jgi:hypothetical protein